jgi:hypothetical protein
MAREDKQRQDGKALSGPGPRQFTKEEWQTFRRQLTQRIQELETQKQTPPVKLPDPRKIVSLSIPTPRGVLRRHPEMKQMETELFHQQGADQLDILSLCTSPPTHRIQLRFAPVDR